MTGKSCDFNIDRAIQKYLCVFRNDFGAKLVKTDPNMGGLGENQVCQDKMADSGEIAIKPQNYLKFNV